MQRTVIFIILFLTSVFGKIESSFDHSLSIEEPSTAEFVTEDLSIQPGRPFWVAFSLKLQPGWHAYWRFPGDAGMAPKIDWDLPQGFKVGTVEWPFPEFIEEAGMIGFGYSDEAFLLIELIPPDILPEKEVVLKGDAKWLTCSNSACQPGFGDLSFTLPVKNEDPLVNQKAALLFEKVRSRLPAFNPPVKVSAQGELLEISLNMEDEKGFIPTVGYFCPEDGEHIDYKKKITFSAPNDEDFNWKGIVLRSDLSKNRLQGVLVAVAENGEKRAFALDHSINGSASDDFEKNAIGFVPIFNDIADQVLKTETTNYVGGFWLALGLAFIGGIILNLMPCVLPVLSFKVLSFVKLSGSDRSITLRHGLAFAFGILLSFWILATLLLLLQSYGRAIGWGFQLQEPLFVGILCALLVAFSLNLFGVFEIGSSMTALAGKAENASHNSKGAYFGSFCSGILATALATPCSGPFLGSAIGIAVSQPPLLAIAVFTSLGLGMASPYLILAAFPRLLRFLPRPGPWMDTFKQLMGFLLLGSALWLAWVFSSQTNSLSLLLLLVALFVITFGAWVFGKWATPAHRKSSRIIASLIALMSLAMAFQTLSTAVSPEILGSSSYLADNGTDHGGWENFSMARVEELREKGTPILIDFTAKWCLICQANHLVFETQDVSEELKKLGVVKLKADWTKSDPEITKALKEFGRNSVPLYLLYGVGSEKEPLVLPQVLTPDIILQALKEKVAEPLEQTKVVR